MYSKTYDFYVKLIAMPQCLRIFTQNYMTKGDLDYAISLLHYNVQYHGSVIYPDGKSRLKHGAIGRTEGNYFIGFRIDEISISISNNRNYF